MLTIILFYLATFVTGFAFYIMPGPVAIEVFHHALKKQNIHALSIGLGAAVGDSIWAMVAFSYTILMIAITRRIKSLFTPGKTVKIIKSLGYLLIFFSLYFLFFSLRAFFS